MYAHCRNNECGKSYDYEIVMKEITKDGKSFDEYLQENGGYKCKECGCNVVSKAGYAFFTSQP